MAIRNWQFDVSPLLTFQYIFIRAIHVCLFLSLFRSLSPSFILISVLRGFYGNFAGTAQRSVLLNSNWDCCVECDGLTELCDQFSYLGKKPRFENIKHIGRYLHF